MVKIYHTQGPIWWNTGNEVKPNNVALDKFKWKECENFNVSWIDETHIRVIVPTNHTTTMIKIEDDTTTTPVKYFYLAEVLNRTTANHECIYELDIWLTYLKGAINDIRSIRTLDVNTLSDTINIEPVGVPTGRIIKESVSFEATVEADLIRANVMAETNIPDQRPYPGITTNIYYVFKAKYPAAGNVNIIEGMKYLNKLPNYVLVPLLNIQGYGFTKTYRYILAENTPIKTKVADILNSYNNIQALINHNSDYGNQGLGEFIGIWIGPNYFRLKEKGIQVKQYDVGDNWNKGDGPNNRATMFTEDILVDYNDGRYTVINASQRGRGAYLALRVDSMPLSMTPLKNSVNKELFLKGLRYQENQDNHLIIAADSVAFNQGFNYTNGVETTTVNINVPIAYDGYYDMLNQQKHTLNTSLALSGVNSIVQGVGALTGLIPPEPRTRTSTRTETRDYQGPRYEISNDKVRITKQGKRGGMIPMGWKTTRQTALPNIQKLSKTTNYSSTVSGGFGYGNVFSAVMGVASAGAQFISTLAQQKAYKDDLRIATSSAVLNENDRYLNWYKIASTMPTLTKAETDNQNGSTIEDLLSVEFLSGAETEPGIAYKFYGVDSQPQVVSITDNMEAYLQITDNQALSLQNQWGTSYTPTIKEGMLSLLTEGIRITGDVIR